MVKAAQGNSEFSKRLQEVRSRAEKGREDMAIDLHVSKTSIGNYERGERDPDVKFLSRLHQLTGVNLNWLVSGKGSQYISNNFDALDVDLLEKCMRVLEEKGQLDNLETKNKALLIATLYEQLLKERYL